MGVTWGGLGVAYNAMSSEQLAEVLLEEGTKWFDIGIFLGATTEKLNEIDRLHGTDGVTRCLIELHRDCLARNGNPLTALEDIATALRRLGNNGLADSIHLNYILPTIHSASSEKINTTVQQATLSDIPTSDVNHVVAIKDKLVLIDEFGEEFQSLSERFTTLNLNIWQCFEAVASNIDMQHMQALIKDQCGLPPLLEDEATIESVFYRVQKQCSVLNFHPLALIVNTLLSNEETLQKELVDFRASVVRFKGSAKMVNLVRLVKSHQPNVTGDNHTKVKLRVRDFWIEFTMKQFEVMMNSILGTLYDQLSHITVGTGCICHVGWIIPPSVDYTTLLPKLSLEFLQIIGVKSLHIGDDVIYNVGEEGCQILEAAMLQAIELKNVPAIELLLAVGCCPEVASYNGNHAVTNVVNIRERSVDDGSGGHVCVLGHNEHIEAIIDTSKKPECATCRMKEKQIKQLYIQTDTLKLKIGDLCHEHEMLALEHANKGVVIFFEFSIIT